MIRRYLDDIDNIVVNTIKDTSDFYDLISNCAGIHPIEIINSIDRIYKDGNLDDLTYKSITSSISQAKQCLLNKPKNNLPIPHQLDYDWRFSESGIDTFVIRINELINSKSFKRIAFIGSPSLFRYYCEAGTKNIDIFLIDFNANKHIKKEFLPSNAYVVNCNLNYDLDMELKVDQINADIVVMDPPWYPEYYKKFFDITDIIGSVKCLVYGVFPPLLTRESILSERNEINSYIKNYGFNNIEYDPLCIEYCTPPFEQNVLKANGIYNFPTCWRKGDFFSTYRNSKTTNCYGSTGIVIRNGGWTEVNIRNVRFKLRQSAICEDEEFNIRVDSLYNNDIYPSVSRRYKGHEKINVWTSGNRVYYCSNIPTLFMIFEHLYDIDIASSFEEDYGVILSDLQRCQIEKVQENICLIIDLELEEYGEWS